MKKPYEEIGLQVKSSLSLGDLMDRILEALGEIEEIEALEVWPMDTVEEEPPKDESFEERLTSLQERGLAPYKEAR